MRNLIANLTKGERWFIGIVLAMLMTNSGKIPGLIGIFISAITAAAFLTFVILCIKTPAKPSSKEIAQLQAQEKRQAEIDAVKKKDEEAKAERDEWERTHGCIKTPAKPSSKEIAQLQAQEKRQAEIDAIKKKDEEAKAERAEWERTHGRIKTKIAGVTFKNEDGTSRQSILKEYAASGSNADVEVEIYDFEGEPAIRVKWEGYTIGNIPKSKVQEILAVEDCVDFYSLNVETFTPSDVDDDWDDEGNTIHASREKIYRADLTVVYSKE